MSNLQFGRTHIGSSLAKKTLSAHNETQERKPLVDTHTGCPC